MEGLCERLGKYSLIIDILGSIRTLPNADQEYGTLNNIFKLLQEEMVSLQLAFDECKNLVLLQRSQIESIQSLKLRIEHICNNRDYFVFEKDDSVTLPSEPTQTAPESKHLPAPTPNKVNNTNEKSPARLPSKVKSPLQNAPTNVITRKPPAGMDITINYISNQEFDKIPQYMKGRIRYDEINNFIDLFNIVLNKKYSLLKKPKMSVKLKKEQDLLLQWREQITPALTDQYFLTANDFTSLHNLKLSKKDFTILTILRHVQRLKDVRIKKSSFYVACF